MGRSSLSNLRLCEGYVQCTTDNVMLCAHISVKTSVSDIYWLPWLMFACCQCWLKTVWWKSWKTLKQFSYFLICFLGTNGGIKKNIINTSITIMSRISQYTHRYIPNYLICNATLNIFFYPAVKSIITQF